jgi:tripartite ATP-independent transporter DctP family solute receptor
MLKLKKLLSITLSVLMILALAAGCSKSEPSSGSSSGGGNEPSAGTNTGSGDSYVFKIANQAPPGDPQYDSFVYLEEILEERSGGRIQVTYYPNSTLGSSNQEQTEMTMSGAIQFTTCPGFTFIALDSSLKSFNVTDYPFLFQSDEESFRFYDSELNAKMRTEAEEKLKTIKIYPAFNMGWYSLYSSKGPIHIPGDIAGQKIRVSVNDLYVRVMEAWGASATPVSWTEVYTSLQQKVCDGLSTPTLLFNIQKFYEVQPYMCVLNYGALSHYPVLNKSWYESLPDDLREIFDECMVDYLATTRRWHTETEAAAVDAIREAGVDVYVPTDEEMKAWQDPIIPLWEELADYAGAEIVTQVREMNGR